MICVCKDLVRDCLISILPSPPSPLFFHPSFRLFLLFFSRSFLSFFLLLFSFFFFFSYLNYFFTILLSFFIFRVVSMNLHPHHCMYILCMFMLQILCRFYLKGTHACCSLFIKRQILSLSISLLSLYTLYIFIYLYYPIKDAEWCICMCLHQYRFTYSPILTDVDAQIIFLRLVCALYDKPGKVWERGRQGKREGKREGGRRKDGWKKRGEGGEGRMLIRQSLTRSLHTHIIHTQSLLLEDIYIQTHILRHTHTHTHTHTQTQFLPPEDICIHPPEDLHTHTSFTHSSLPLTRPTRCSISFV